MAPLRYPEPEYEDDYEVDNWGEASSRSSAPEPDYDYEDGVAGDVWDDDEAPAPYSPPRVNIPETRREKMPEYYEE